MTLKFNRRHSNGKCRHLARLTLLASLLAGWTTVSVGQQPEQPKDAAPAVVDRADQQNQPLVLKAVPNNIQINSNVNFNENGVVNGQSAYFSMSFFVVPPPNLAIRNIRNAKVNVLLTDSGEDLAVNIPQNQHEHMQVPQDMFLAPGANPNRHQNNRRPIGINPPLPKKACRKITRLQGTATIEVSKGEAKRVNIGQIKAVEGKRIQIEGIENGWFQFVSTNNPNMRQIQLATNSETITKIARVYFFNPDGTLVQNQGHNISHVNRGQANASITLNIYGQFQEGTTAVIIMYPESEAMDITFEGTDIPLPQIFSQGSELFDMVMKLEPIDEAFALADIAPKPQPQAANPAAKPAPKPAPAARPQPQEENHVKPIPADIKQVPEIGFKVVEAEPANAKPAVNPIGVIRAIVR